MLYAPLFLLYLPFFLLVYSPFLGPSLIAYLVLVWRVTRRRVAVALGPLSGAGALLAPGLDPDTRIYDSPALAIGILLGGVVYGRFVRLSRV